MEFNDLNILFDCAMCLDTYFNKFEHLYEANLKSNDNGERKCQKHAKKILPAHFCQQSQQSDLTMCSVPENLSDPGCICADDPRFRIQPHQQMASACTGGIITSLIMTPLDVVKTRIQTQQKLLLSNKCFLYCNGLMDHLCPCGPNSSSMRNHVHLNGILDAFVKISRAEGVKSLWSGLTPTLVSALPSTIIYFVAYEQIRRYAKEKHNQLTGSTGMPVYVPMLSGITSRTFAVTVVSPFELIRTKMQSQKMSYSQLTASVRSMIRSNGILVLWKGLRPTIYRDVPFSGIYWSCYEAIKYSYRVTEPSFGFSFFAGGVSGSIAAAITTPFDLIKTYQQIEFGEQVIYTDKPQKDIALKSTWERLIEVKRAHGFRGLFAGLGPRLAKVSPACAIMISSFEFGKAFFYKQNIQRYDDMLIVQQINSPEGRKNKLT